ncbi:MAG TPA: hypothetical protein VD866_10970 [Urbifossiella sp.]|nr:hypothetical protein [Urbifossiella sp.]
MAKKKDGAAEFLSRPSSSGIPRVKPASGRELPDDIARMVERMRKSRAAAGIHTKEEAAKFGRMWAVDAAEPWEVERLEKQMHELRNADSDDTAKTFFAIISNCRPGDWEPTRDFFSDNVGVDRQEDWEKAEFVIAFAEGAIAAWQAAKREILAG